MSYAAAIDQLNAMVPELYTSSGQSRRKFSLDEIRVLLDALGNPHLRFPSVLIAGTNGKGSTAATLASILTLSGVRAGLYTSPHLERANERIRLDRVEIDDDSFAALYFCVHDAAQQLVLDHRLQQLPSYFEILTAQAFLYFAQGGAEIAVLEVGMGGRLDATNCVDPLLSVITDISLDHTEWLGSTIAAITREKVGILRAGGTLITLPQHPEANQVIGEVATSLDVHAVSAVPYMPSIGAGTAAPYSVQVLGEQILVDSPLTGAHQHRNLALAIAAAAELAGKPNFPITPATIAKGIHETRWPGRLERIHRNGVEWILDVAHNPAGAWALRAGLSVALGSANQMSPGSTATDPVPDVPTEVPCPILSPSSWRKGGIPQSPIGVPSSANHNPRTLIFACLRDKPILEMAQILFPLFDRVIFAPIHSARAADPRDLMAAAESTGTTAVAAESVSQALELAQRTGDAVIVISGSVFLVGEARSLLLAAKGALR